MCVGAFFSMFSVLFLEIFSHFYQKLYFYLKSFILIYILLMRHEYNGSSSFYTHFVNATLSISKGSLHRSVYLLF